MNYSARNAVDSWNNEVDNEMARLIEKGVPPFDAAAQAAENVSKRRQTKQRFPRNSPASPTAG